MLSYKNNFCSFCLCNMAVRLYWTCPYNVVEIHIVLLFVPTSKHISIMYSAVINTMEIFPKPKNYLNENKTECSSKLITYCYISNSCYLQINWHFSRITFSFHKLNCSDNEVVILRIKEPPSLNLFYQLIDRC